MSESVQISAKTAAFAADKSAGIFLGLAIYYSHQNTVLLNNSFFYYFTTKNSNIKTD
ncbi:MAG: hypothetical protein ACXAD7_25490 [Candidatus Kariarchaeaceae archaeon]